MEVRDLPGRDLFGCQNLQIAKAVQYRIIRCILQWVQHIHAQAGVGVTGRTDK